MPLYEHVFLVRQDAAATAVEALVEQFKGVIEAGGGKLAKIEPWGVKSLAYRIKKNRKAHFTLLNIDAPAPAVAEMERQMGINEDVLRFMTIRVDEHEEGPSAMLQRRDRDDRDRDRDGRPPRRDGEGGGFGGGFRSEGGGFRGDRDRDGPRGDGPRGDGPRGDGPRGDGPRGDGPRAERPRRDEPAAEE